MPSPRIYADFHNADLQGRVRLNANGTVNDLAALGIALSEGLRLSLTSATSQNRPFTELGNIVSLPVSRF